MKSPQRNNFYAVIISEGTGGTRGTIYTDWSSCRKAINCVSNVIHRKFSTREAAQKFIDTGGSVLHMDAEMNGIKIYINGSSIMNGGFGVIILHTKLSTLYDHENIEDNGDHENVMGPEYDIFKAHGKLPCKGNIQTAELYAILIGLSLVPDENVEIYTNSPAIISTIKSFQIINKKSMNYDLLEKITHLIKGRNVQFLHVLNNSYIEEAKQLAHLGASNDENLLIYKNNELYSE